MPTRRQALRASAVAAAGLLSGCSTVESVFSGDGSGGGFAGGDPERYAQFAAGGRWEWAAFHVAPAELPWERLHEATRRRLESRVAWTGLDAERVDRVVFANGRGLATGDFDRAGARAAVEAEYGATEQTNDGAFDVVYGDGGDWTPVLVGDGVVVTVGPVQDASPPPQEDLVRELYGDWDGSVSGLASDGSLPDDVRRVVDALGAPAVASVGPSPLVGGSVGGPPQAPTARRFGTGWDVGQDRTTMRTAYVYPEGETPDASSVGDVYPEFADDDLYVRGIEDYGDRRVSSSDRTVTVTADAPTGQFDLLYPGNPTPPDASFSLSFADDAVTVTHAGGEAVPADVLRVVVGEGGAPRPAFRNPRRVVDEGDSGTTRIDAASGTRVAVEWRAGIDPTVRETVATGTVPGESG